MVDLTKAPAPKAMPDCKTWPHNPPHCGCPA